jgi:hypothetical protein
MRTWGKRWNENLFLSGRKQWTHYILSSLLLFVSFGIREDSVNFRTLTLGRPVQWQSDGEEERTGV